MAAQYVGTGTTYFSRLTAELTCDRYHWSSIL